MGVFCVIDSNRGEGNKKGAQRTSRGRGFDDGPEQEAEGAEGKSHRFRRIEHTEEGVESRERNDEAPLDDDPRVIIGLNRLIDIIVNTPNENSGVATDDD